MTTLTIEEQRKIAAWLDEHPVLSVGVGTGESACSIAAINLALTGELTDEIPECMSPVIGAWVIKIQDAMPAEIRNSAAWRGLLPLAAGTGNEHEDERLEVVLDWMWGVVLPLVQPVADAGGYGAAWRAMTTVRSARAAGGAADAAAYAAAAAAYAADAADAAAAAAGAARATAARAAARAARAARAAGGAGGAAAGGAGGGAGGAAAGAGAVAGAGVAAYAAAAARAGAAYDAYAVYAAADAYAASDAAADAAAAAADAAAGDFWNTVDPVGLLARLVIVSEKED